MAEMRKRAKAAADAKCAKKGKNTGKRTRSDADDISDGSSDDGGGGVSSSGGGASNIALRLLPVAAAGR